MRERAEQSRELLSVLATLNTRAKAPVMDVIGGRASQSPNCLPSFFLLQTHNKRREQGSVTSYVRGKEKEELKISAAEFLEAVGKEHG